MQVQSKACVTQTRRKNRHHISLSYPSYPIRKGQGRGWDVMAVNLHRVTYYLQETVAVVQNIFILTLNLIHVVNK